MRKKYWWALAIVATLVVPACSHSSPSSNGKVTINWWQDTEDTGTFEHNVIKAFEAKYPNIKVNLTTYPQSQYYTKVDTAVAAGAAPDVVGLPSLTWMKDGLLVPLDGMVKADHIDLAGYNPAIVGAKGQYNAAFSCAYGGKKESPVAWRGAGLCLFKKKTFNTPPPPPPPAAPPPAPACFSN